MPTTRRIVWRGRTLRILALGFAGFGVAYVARAPEMAGLTGIVLPTRTASITRTSASPSPPTIHSGKRPT
jgi:hypothetical protein